MSDQRVPSINDDEVRRTISKQLGSQAGAIIGQAAAQVGDNLLLVNGGKLSDAEAAKWCENLGSAFVSALFAKLTGRV